MQTEGDGARGLLDEALSRLEDELTEVRRLRDEVEAEYKTRLEPLNNRVKSLETAVGHQRGALESYGGIRVPGPEKEDGKKLTDLAYRALKTLGEPMHYQRLAEQLIRNGASLSGKVPGTILINYLRREPERFCRTATPGNYALVEWQLADAKPVSGERRASRTPKRASRAKSPTKRATSKRKPRRKAK